MLHFLDRLFITYVFFNDFLLPLIESRPLPVVVVRRRQINSPLEQLVFRIALRWCQKPVGYNHREAPFLVGIGTRSLLLECFR